MTFSPEFALGYQQAMRDMRATIRAAHDIVAALDTGETPGRARAAYIQALAAVYDAMLDGHNIAPIAERRTVSPESPMMTARAKGYTGDECPECGHLTMVRNGTCLKCETCGATTGCS